MKPKWVPEEVFDDYIRHSWRSLTETFEKVLLGLPAASLLRQITVIPILNLTGEAYDEICCRGIEQANVTNISLPGSHLMLLEHRDRVTSIIEEFLAEGAINSP